MPNLTLLENGQADAWDEHDNDLPDQRQVLQRNAVEKHRQYLAMGRAQESNLVHPVA